MAMFSLWRTIQIPGEARSRLSRPFDSLVAKAKIGFAFSNPFEILWVKKPWLQTHDSKRPPVKRVALIACFFTASGGKRNDASTGVLCLFRLRRKFQTSRS